MEPGPDDGHWYVLSLNLKAKKFEVLDSLREEDSPSLLEHATRYMNAIKMAWLISYKDSHKQIQDYELVYIDVLKQENGLVVYLCSFYLGRSPILCDIMFLCSLTLILHFQH